MNERQRVDVWLFRTRMASTRAEAARLVSEGGVRLVHNGVSRRLEKPSVEIEAGDVLVFAQSGVVQALKVAALPARRGSAPEARRNYALEETDA